MIDERGKDLLESLARHLTLGISREEHRLPLEMGPHPLDRGRWCDFFDHVIGPSKEPPENAMEVARDAELIRTLLLQYGLSPAGATHWASEFRREREGCWER